MNKKITVSIVTLFCMLLISVQFVRAQWSMPSDQTTDAPAPINTGDQLQYKKGPLQFVLKNAENLDYRKWSDASWLATPGYAIDTDAPISAHGALFTGKIVAPKIIDTSMRSAQFGSTEICANKLGQYVSCATVSGTTADTFSMTTTLAVQPTSIPANVATPIEITWSNSGAESCSALQGPGFVTDGNKTGSIQSSPITLSENQKQVFTLVCVDTLGRSQFATAVVTASSVVLPAPIINLYFSSPLSTFVRNMAVARSLSDNVTMQLSINPNGGGTMQCRKQVFGTSVRPSNPWSGQASGVWSAYTSMPPNNEQDINTCRTDGVCTAGDIVTDANTSVLLVLECKNASGNSTTIRNHLSVSQ